MTSDDPESVTVGGQTIDPGEKRRFRYDAGETYHGDALEIPVTVVNGDQPGPRMHLSAAADGDEMYGVKIVLAHLSSHLFGVTIPP